MSKSNDYDELLNRTPDDMPEDVLTPDGVWALVIRSAAFAAPKKEGQNARVLFFMTPKQPIDVDEGLLAELGPDYDPTENEIIHTIWIERARDWQKVRTVLEAAGTFDAKATWQDNLKSARKGELSAVVGTRTFERSNGDQGIENVVSNFQPIE